MYRCGLILPALLLIVPYGIETHYRMWRYYQRYPFNRTLWN